jgi:lipoprotein-anchoring transpeptidase ErfK/SrfK
MNKTCRLGGAAALAAIIAATAFVSEASANPFNFFGQPLFGYGPPTDNGNQARADLQRRVVEYRSNEAPGGQAIRYGIGVGREGFTWSGVKTVERKAEWPDWTPPPEMIERSPYLPRFTAGGEGNPLGARAMYLSGSFYRIHGTNAPWSIGSRATSGCIRMVNDDVIDLYSRVKVGTKVIVLPATEQRTASGFRAFF